MEIDLYIKELARAGYPWQSRLLRSWKFRFWHDLQPLKGADSIKKDGGDS